MQEESIVDQDQVTKVSSMKLKWALGLNYKIYDGVHNLTNKNRKQLFYAVGNTGVIYDYQNNVQRLLQGHCNQITCTAYNRQRQILITADSGEDSMLVIWDVNTGVPKKTIFDPHHNGVTAMDVSVDGSLIVTLSKVDQPKNQLITLWKWQEEEPSFITTQLDPRIDCIQKFIKFNTNQNEFVTTGETRLIFWSWDNVEKGFEFYSPNMPPKKTFTQTVFIPNSSQAVTGTKDGIIIVWDISLIMQDYSQPQERRPIKQVNLMSNNNKIDAMKKNVVQPSINVLKIEGRFLVVGSSNGCVRFYDDQYRIQAWFQDIDIGSIHTISFSSETTTSDKEGSLSKEQQIQQSLQKFNCPDFIVVDDKARITLLKAQLFEKIDKQQKKGQILIQSIVAPIVSSAVRPHSNTIAISCQNSLVYQWNFQEKTSVINVLREFKPEEVPICLNYSPNSKYLSVATKIGTIHIYEVQTGEWQPQLLVAQVEKGKSPVTMQIFAPDSKHLATMDQDFGVTLFVLGQRNWSFGGKIRVHYAPIRSISFGQSMDQRSQIKLRLFSISEDMKMAEYQIQTKKEQSNQSNKYNKLKLKSIFPIQQECFPTACIWYPINLYKQNVLLTVNQQYKMKLWSMMKDNLKVCKKTCLGPTYGGQINKLLVLNPVDQKNDYQDKYLAYSTKQKVVGIIKLPLDGNPNNTIGLIAHSNKITSINSTVDGKLFFTSGADDFCVNIWEVDFAALQQNFLVPQNQDPFPELLEGGPTGQTMADLKDFFYYSQIRSKDQHTTKARKLDGKVPLQAIANMMRSMGYYPTQKQIQNMQNEIKFSTYMQNFKETVNQLDLNMFLKLFVNHRPVYGIGKSHISNALNVLTEDTQKKTISREQLINILKTEGEKMTNQQILECEKILLGEQDGQFPEEIDAQILCHKILGFEDLENQKDNEQEDIQDEEN